MMSTNQIEICLLPPKMPLITDHPLRLLASDVQYCASILPRHWHRAMFTGASVERGKKSEFSHLVMPITPYRKAQNYPLVWSLGCNLCSSGHAFPEDE